MEEDIRPLKGPAQLWDWWSFLGWLLLAFLIMALVITALWLWKRRKKASAIVEETGPPRPAHEIALEALNRLANSDFLKRQELKRFYIELSEIFRQYLSAHYGMDTLDRTTWEITQALRELGVSLTLIETIRDILEESDLVKFAKYYPPLEVPMQTLERVRELVIELAGLRVSEFAG